MARIASSLDEVAFRSSHKVGQYGKGVLLGEARSMFGADRKPSNWKRGRKTVNARYTVKRQGATVHGELYPTGDPFYVFVKGRTGGERIESRKNSGARRRKLALAVGGKGSGGYRMTSRVGHMAARPHHWSQPARLIMRRIPDVYADATRLMITKQLRG